VFAMRGARKIGEPNVHDRCRPERENFSLSFKKSRCAKAKSSLVK